MAYKTVLLPIEVSASGNCWDEDNICGYFNNEGGHCRCDLMKSLDLNYNKDGIVEKPFECLKLTNAVQQYPLTS